MTTRRGAALLLALACAGAGMGCGAVAQPGAQGSVRGASPAPAGSARAPAPARPSDLAAIHRQVLAALRRHDGGTYGRIPAYLKGRQGRLVDRVLVATAGHPVRSVQGLGVQLRTPSGVALITPLGPEVPEQVKGTGAPNVDVGFTVTFRRLRGHPPEDPGAFTVADESGRVVRPRLLFDGARRRVDGSWVTFTLRALLPVGDGKLRYAPAGRTLISWDYSLETD